MFQNQYIYVYISTELPESEYKYIYSLWGSWVISLDSLAQYQIIAPEKSDFL